MGGEFKPGQSGNPNGWPKGARNKTDSSTKKLLDDAVDGITRRMIEVALESDHISLVGLAKKMRFRMFIF